MSTAAEQLQIPLAPGAEKPFEAPMPVVCSWCSGSAVEPDEEVGPIPCLACDACGVVPADFDLPRTRAYEARHVRYLPVCGTGVVLGELVIGTAVKETHTLKKQRYQLTEFENDWAGRSFFLAKVRDTKRKHRLYVGPDGVSCSCEGEVYQSTAKSNQKAYDTGQEVFVSYGCKHLDAIVSLLKAGWLDL